MKNRNLIWRQTALAAALSMGLAGVVMAQSTTGSIFGQAEPGDTVTVTSGSTGLSRDVAVDSSGRYRVSNLPVGAYSVTLKKDGTVVSTRNDVTISPGSGSAVNFATETTNLSAVTVTGNALPAIDVSSVNSSTVITAADLQKLPVTRNAESIALLAPGTVQGSNYFANAVSFGGSSVSENAYYVNGYNTGEPYRNIGGFQLPYGAIDQQETLTGGYSAKYGRSDGGVINQIGKRGTNEWHFGGQVIWEPRYLEASPRNNPYGNPAIPSPIANPDSIDGLTHYQLEDPSKPGTLYQYRNDNKQWETVYSAYVGGPLIKDKLFMFLAAETTKTNATNVQNVDLSRVQYNENKTSKFYGKLDWNITDNNILELTVLKNHQYGNNQYPGSTYNFDYDTLQATTLNSTNDVQKDNATFYIGHFTSYITDNATLSIVYGKANFQTPTSYGNDCPYPFISQSYNENPAFTGGKAITNCQTNLSWYSDDATLKTHGLRVDFDYRLGDHDLSAGIDNMYYGAKNQGPNQQNPFNPAVNYYWRYYPTYVQKREIGWQTNMTTSQKAWYLQDAWQVTSNVLLNVGLRNDHFTNFNDVGESFADLKNQWEPRIGASWDVFGDSTFKVYGNVGRYYLALPQNAAERAANRSTYIRTYYNYTGIDENGIPTGLEFIKQNSPDGEFGLPKDPDEVTARNLKPEYLDEFIVGFDKTLNEKWTYGAKAMWRDLKSAIDDECSPDAIETKMQKLGLITTTDIGDENSGYYNSLYGPSSCRLFNPGRTNDFLVRADAGSGKSDQIVSMTNEDFGFNQGVKRKVGSVNLYLEHPFDGKWQARIDYTWTRGFGNTEGQVRSDFGQGDVSKTEDWDNYALMDGQNGELINIHKHQIRVRGAYQITPEWLVSGTLLAQSGQPTECLGYYGPYGVDDPAGYNGGGSGNYHWCAGKRVPPGTIGHTPWTKPLNLGIHYTPDFADHKLGFHLDVFNVFNEQKPVQTDPVFANAYNGGVPDADGNKTAPDVIYVNNSYHQALYYETPRTVRLSVTYDY
jgi:outer membrane receptor for ferrienterochelin and colicin